MLMVGHGQTVDGPGVQVARELLRTLAARRLHVVVGGRLLLPRISSTHGLLQSSAIDPVRACPAVRAGHPVFDRRGLRMRVECF